MSDSVEPVAPSIVFKRSDQFYFEDFDRLVNIAHQRGLTFSRGSNGNYRVTSPEGSTHTVNFVHCDASCTAHQTSGVCSHRAYLIFRMQRFQEYVPIRKDGTPVNWTAEWRKWLNFERQQDAGVIGVDVPPKRGRRRKESAADDDTTVYIPDHE